MKPTKTTALQSLLPDAQWVWRGDQYSGLEWHSPDITRPTEEEIEAELTRLTQEWDAKEYARRRSEEYPSTDQLIVALWEQIVEGKAGPVDQIQALRELVKAKFPKQ